MLMFLSGVYPQDISLLTDETFGTGQPIKTIMTIGKIPGAQNRPIRTFSTTAPQHIRVRRASTSNPTLDLIRRGLFRFEQRIKTKISAFPNKVKTDELPGGGVLRFYFPTEKLDIAVEFWDEDGFKRCCREVGDYLLKQFYNSLKSIVGGEDPLIPRVKMGAYFIPHFKESQNHVEGFTVCIEFSLPGFPFWNLKQLEEATSAYNSEILSLIQKELAD